MPNWTVDGTLLLSEQDETRALREWNELLQESFSDLERMYLQDPGWRALGAEEQQLTLKGRRQIAAHARFLAAANPMIKRGLGVRVGYVWGQGVQVSIDDDGADDTQDVNTVIEAFWDDPSNRKTFTDSQAEDQLERQLGTDGEVFLALPTNPVTGRVQVRSLLPEEIDTIIHDPDDMATDWFYLRVYSQVDQFTGKTVTKRVLYPALGYWPQKRPTKMRVLNQDCDVRWDAPVRAVQVNVPSGQDRGLGDSVAALPWAKAHKEFLEDWTLLTKALSRIAWRVTTRGDRAQKAARAVSVPTGTPENPRAAGSTVGVDPNTTLEAVPKTGAQIDAESGKPLQTMIAAGLGIPVTMLLGDPGTTGARAVAETLDQPTEDEMGLRRKVWTAAIRDICDHVIDQAVIAPSGTLRGTTRQDGTRRIVTLPATDSRLIKVDWPAWDSVPLESMMKAISLADSTDKLPPLLAFKLIATAFGVEDVDDWVEKVTDDNGNWIPLDVQDQQARGRQADLGGDNGAVTDPTAPAADQGAGPDSQA